MKERLFHVLYLLTALISLAVLIVEGFDEVFFIFSIPFLIVLAIHYVIGFKSKS